MLDTKYLIPGLMFGSVVHSVVYPFPAATATASRSVMVMARLHSLRLRNGWAVEQRRIVCTGSSYTGPSIPHLP